MDRKVDINKIKERITENMQYPAFTRDWITVCKDLNVSKIRRLLKKERSKLPPQYKRLYQEPDDKLLLMMHFLRTQYPFFTAQEVGLSHRFIQLQQQIADGDSSYLNWKP